MIKLLLPLLLLACGPKKAPEPAASPVAAPVAEAATPEPEAAPEPPPPPPDVVNADLKVTITYGNGSTKSGHVKRVERSTDWYGEQDWDQDKGKLKISGEQGNSAKEITWDLVKSITVVPGKVPSEVDCVYDSNWSPWMYDCTVKTVGTVVLKDGTKWTVANRHKWRLTFDDGSSAEMWLYKHPAREQDSRVMELDTANPENLELYTKLQNRIREEVKTTLVVKIAVE